MVNRISCVETEHVHDINIITSISVKTVQYHKYDCKEANGPNCKCQKKVRLTLLNSERHNKYVDICFWDNETAQLKDILVSMLDIIDELPNQLL